MSPSFTPGAAATTSDAPLPVAGSRTPRVSPWSQPEVTAALVAIAVAIGTLLMIVGHLRTIDLDPGCISTLAASKRSGGCFSDGGHAALLRLVDGEIALTRMALLVLPLLVGALLGAPVVARALATGRFAVEWAVPPARVTRLARRSWRRALLVAVGLGVVGWLAAEVQWQTTPWLSPGSGQLATYATYGPLLPARGLLVLALAVLAGAVLGRSLLAGCVALVLGAVLVSGGTELVRRTWIEAYPAQVSDVVPLPGEMLARTDTRWRAVDGRLLTDEQVKRLSPGMGRGQKFEAWRRETFTETPVFIPVSALPDLERTELLVTVGATLVAVTAAGVAVTVRRPRS